MGVPARAQGDADANASRGRRRIPDAARRLARAQERDRGEDSVLLEHAHRARAVGAAEERGAGGRRRRARARRRRGVAVVRRRRSVVVVARARVVRSCNNIACRLASRVASARVRARRASNVRGGAVGAERFRQMMAKTAVSWITRIRVAIRARTRPNRTLQSQRARAHANDARAPLTDVRDRRDRSRARRAREWIANQDALDATRDDDAHERGAESAVRPARVPP